jgi:hypothetical protein
MPSFGPQLDPAMNDVGIGSHVHRSLLIPAQIRSGIINPHPAEGVTRTLRQSGIEPTSEAWEARNKNLKTTLEAKLRKSD